MMLTAASKAQFTTSRSPLTLLPPVDLASPYAEFRQVQAQFDPVADWVMERSLALGNGVEGAAWFPFAEGLGPQGFRYDTGGTNFRVDSGGFYRMPVLCLPQRLPSQQPEDRHSGLGVSFCAVFYPGDASHVPITQVTGYRKSLTAGWAPIDRFGVNFTLSELDIRSASGGSPLRFMITVVLQPTNLNGQYLYLSMDAFTAFDVAGRAAEAPAPFGDPLVRAQVRPWISQAAPALKQAFNEPYPPSQPPTPKTVTVDERSFFRLHCYQEPADTNGNGIPDAYESAFSDVFISEVCFFNTKGVTIYLPGASSGSPPVPEYPDWFEVYNPTATMLDLTEYYLVVTDEASVGAYAMPQVEIAPGQTLGFYCSGVPSAQVSKPYRAFNFNFKLANGGATLQLYRYTHPNHLSVALVDTFQIPTTQRTHSLPDISFGRCVESGLIKTRYFSRPTFEAKNTAHGATFVAREPRIIDATTLGGTESPLGGGFRDSGDSVSVALLPSPSEQPGSVIILYTLDGNEPNGNSYVYSGPFQLSRTTVLRARTFRSDGIPSATISRTFIFPEDVPQQNSLNSYTFYGFEQQCAYKAEVVQRHSWQGAPGETETPQGIMAELKRIPTVSISANQAAVGTIPNYAFAGLAEGVHTSFEWIDPADPGSYRQENCKFERVGESSLTRQKGSFELTFTKPHTLTGKSYWQGPTNGQGTSALFPGSAVTRFSKLRLRNGIWGGWAHKPDRELCVSDAYLKETAKRFGQLNVERRFVHVYVNGEYYGIFDVEEKVDEEFVAAHMAVRDPGHANLWKPENILMVNFNPASGSASLDPRVNEVWDRVFTAVRAAADNPSQSQDLAGVKAVLDLDDLLNWLLVHSIVRPEDFDTYQWKGWVRFSIDSEGLPVWDKVHFLSWDGDTMNQSGPISSSFAGEMRGLNPNWEKSPLDLSGQFFRTGSNQQGGLHAGFRQALRDRVLALRAAGQPLSNGQAQTRWNVLALTWQRVMHAEAMRWGSMEALNYWKAGAIGPGLAPLDFYNWVPTAEATFLQDLTGLGFGTFATP